MPIPDEIHRRLTKIEMREHDMLLHFDDGGDATAPYWWYPRLQNATPKQREEWEILPFGDAVGGHDLDEYVSAKALLAGGPAPGATAPLEAVE